MGENIIKIKSFAIAQKEANETDYWLELLFQSNYLTESGFQVLKMTSLK